MKLRIGFGAALAIAALALPLVGGTAVQAAPPLPLTVSPSSVAVGETVTVSGEGCGYDTGSWGLVAGRVNVELDGKITSVVFQDGEIDASDGSWSVEIAAPATADEYTISASCEYYGFSFSYLDGTVTVTDQIVPNVPVAGWVPNTFMTAPCSAQGGPVQPVIAWNDTGASGPYIQDEAGYVYPLNDAIPLPALLPGAYTYWFTLPNPTTLEPVKSAISTLVIAQCNTDGGNLPETGGPGAAPATPTEGALTDAPQGGLSLVQISGNNVMVLVGTGLAGQTVFGTVFSTPRSLGSAVVDAKGRVTFALPSGLETGLHRIAVQRADGTLVGWVSITLNSDGSWTSEKLARTGVASLLPFGIAGAVLLGSGAVLIFRRGLLGGTTRRQAGADSRKNAK